MKLPPFITQSQRWFDLNLPVKGLKEITYFIFVYPHRAPVANELYALTSEIGTKRKCHRRLVTSAFGRLTDIRIMVRDFRF